MVAIPSKLLSPTLTAIDAARESAEKRGQDVVVRGSSIGRPCERDLWYRFRWAREPETFSGRMLRLFETGHRDEDRMIADLRAAGVTVEAVDPETGQQWEVVDLDGHFKGHLDGIVTGLLEAPKTAHLLECKTHNEKSFTQLTKHGVAIAKPEHVAQMQVYMHLMGLTRAFYMAKNKNNDELYSERVDYDAAAALALTAKAERILEANRPLAKISEDASSWSCRFCPSKGVCHEGTFGLRNCRTCLHSTPVGGGDARWHCALHDLVLSFDEQEVGCANHLFIPDLVPGEQIDVGDDAASVLYTLADGSEWWDGRNESASAPGGAS